MKSPTETATISGVAREETLTETIVEAVAEVQDVGPCDLRPLYEVIDPDALETLCRSKWSQPHQPLSVEFRYEGCTVVVGGDREVRVSQSTAPERSA